MFRSSLSIFRLNFSLQIHVNWFDFINFGLYLQGLVILGFEFYEIVQLESGLAAHDSSFLGLLLKLGMLLSFWSNSRFGFAKL